MAPIFSSFSNQCHALERVRLVLLGQDFRQLGAHFEDRHLVKVLLSKLMNLFFARSWN